MTLPLHGGDRYRCTRMDARSGEGGLIHVDGGWVTSMQPGTGEGLPVQLVAVLAVTVLLVKVAAEGVPVL